jgi:predicted Zn-dependent protease
VIDGITRTIYVYEFSSQKVLARLLAHEFGHVLDIDHVSNEDSIMYEYNTSQTLELSKEDLAALEVTCSRGSALLRLFKERFNSFL